MAHLKALSLFLAVLSLAVPATGAGSFLRKSEQVTTADVESSLLAELSSNVSSQRLLELEDALRPMYAALPKGDAGYLGHQAVRYALHRLLLQRHGWFIVGLEPSDEARPPYLDGEWVPEYLQGLLEQRLGSRGMDLREVAALAAALEDLVRAEAGRRLERVYGLLGVGLEERLGEQEANRLLETYMMLYLREGNFSAQGLDVDRTLAVFKMEYADWDSAAAWLQQIKGRHLGAAADGKLGRGSLEAVVDELGERFGAFNDGECRSLKGELLGLEGPRPGRVPLLDFYKKGLYSHWEFNEKIEYLRALGALDESDELRPSVILPNYLGSRPNCLAASGLYAVCCRNECEDLVAHLEGQIVAPSAPPQRIRELVSQLPSDTVSAPRELPESLDQRLREIAARHGGQVPLHGRLFTQWMHHAYPRECPYPHAGPSPQTPDEWLREASEDELRQLVGACASGAGASPCGAPAAAAAAEGALPWSDAEVLLEGGQAQAEGLGLFPLFLPLIVPAVLAVLSLRPQRPPATEEFEEESEKPVVRTNRMQQVKVLLILLFAGFSLEFLGVLDHFSLGCTLCGGLLLNLALPLLLRQPEPCLKPGKCCV